MQVATVESSTAERCWRVRVEGRGSSTAPHLRSALPSSAFTRRDVWLTADGDRVIARFHVTGPDVAAAASAAIERWNDVATAGEMFGWPIESLTVERLDPDEPHLLIDMGDKVVRVRDRRPRVPC